MHGNAKATLKRLQLILKVTLKTVVKNHKKGVCCPQCQGEMRLYLLRIGTRLIINGNTI